MFVTLVSISKNHVLEIQVQKTRFDGDPGLNFFDSEHLHHDFFGQSKINDIPTVLIMTAFITMFQRVMIFFTTVMMAIDMVIMFRIVTMLYTVVMFNMKFLCLPYVR